MELDSLVFWIGALALAILLTVVGCALYYGWQVNRLKRQQRIVPVRLQQRYRQGTQLALFVIVGEGIGLAIVSLLR